MTDIHITHDNITDYPIGTKMICFWGAMYPWEEATVVGHITMPASKFFPEKVALEVETESGETTTYCGRLVKSGIGVYLAEDFMKAA
jgi:hypothetical protein